MLDKDCNVRSGFPEEVQKPMAELVDAFLYLGPSDLALTEKTPADILLDSEYRAELVRRLVLMGVPSPAGMTQKQRDEDIVRSAENPILEIPDPPDAKAFAQGCLNRKKQSATPK
jgi:hypothetical protein